MEYFETQEEVSAREEVARASTRFLAARRQSVVGAAQELDVALRQHRETAEKAQETRSRIIRAHSDGNR